MVNLHTSLFLTILCNLIIYSYHFTIPDSDGGIAGPKLLNLKEEWISIALDPFAHTPLRPIPPINDHWKDSNTIIFISIPHYRDPRCATTVKNLLLKAKYPHRLRFGIVQQRHTEEDFFKCVDDVLTELQGKHDSQGNRLVTDHQFRLIEFTHQQSYGPNFARSFSSQLVQEEDEFCLSVDAHSDVIQHWDEELLTMWASTENEFAILSTQPPDIGQLAEGSHGKVPHLCQATIDKRGMIVNLPPTLATDLDRPILAPLYSEAFSFSKCHAMKKVPNDPLLQMIYDGDEFAKFIRLWTKGYDVYTPNKLVVAHDYHHKLPVIKATNKDINPMEWTFHGNMKKDAIRDLYDQSLFRLTHLYGKGFLTDSGAFKEDDLLIEELQKLHKYGLLTSPPVELEPKQINEGESTIPVMMKRDLFDFMQFSGINTIKKEVYADRCVGLQWIPSHSSAPGSVREAFDPWIEELNVYGASSAERLPANADNIPIQKPSGKVQPIELEFYSIEDYTRLPLVSERDGRNGVAAAFAETAALSDTKEELKNLLMDSPQKIVASKIVPSVEAHRGGELWYVFQWLDSRIEQTINQIDLDLGYGHGHRVMRILLLFFPVVCLLIGFAIYLILPSEKRAKYFDYSDGDNQKVK